MTTVTPVPQELSDGERIQQQIREINDEVTKAEEELKAKKAAANEAIAAHRAKCKHTGKISTWTNVNAFMIGCTHCGTSIWVLPGYGSSKDNWPEDVREAYNMEDFAFFFSPRYKRVNDRH
jgi:hypothetical protein